MVDSNESGAPAQDVHGRDALVIDDHPLFCDALVSTLKGSLDFRDVRTANSLGSGLDILDGGYSPDVVILDLNLPDVSGVDGLIRLKSRVPAQKIVVVSALGDNRVVSAVMAAGAAGFIRKDADRGELERAFGSIWRGEKVFPNGYQPSPAEAGSDATDEVLERLSSLTPQQINILKLVCEGKLNKQIAYELSIAETTVKAHITAILRKLGVQSRTQAALLASEVRYSALLK